MANASDRIHGEELHHIHPVEKGGSNNPSNLVYLTEREHRLAHKLLQAIDNGIIHAPMQDGVSQQKIRYMAKVNYYKSKGMVNYKNDWMTPQEKDRILEENKKNKKTPLTRAERQRAYRLKKSNPDLYQGLSSREILSRHLDY